MTPVLCALALAIDVALILVVSPPSERLVMVGIAAPILLAIGHAEPRRGRGIQTLAGGAILASALIAVAHAVARGASGTSPWALVAAVAAPWGGHALAWLPSTPRIEPGPALLGDRMARAQKRIADVLLGSVFAVVAAPAVAVAAIVVRATSDGPAFYCQTRVTSAGRMFRIWKLRTMQRDAESGTPVWPEDNDPRITRVGRVLRRVWIDELPQIWNVLRGDMSLVGPRPERPEFVEAFATTLPKYRRRHAVSAGITGLAQVVGLIGDTSIRRRLALDLHYVRIWTPCLDAWILWHTVLQAVRRGFGRPPLPARRVRRPARELGGEILELRGIARHLPERDQ